MSANNAGNYTVVITSPYGSVTSAVAKLTVQAPPVITVQPASQIVVREAVLSSRWRSLARDHLGICGTLPRTNLVQSGTNSTLTLPGVSTNNAGNYTVVVTNTYGSVTSQVATLTVLPLAITSQPASQMVTPGTVPLSPWGRAANGPFWYLWYFEQHQSDPKQFNQHADSA